MLGERGSAGCVRAHGTTCVNQGNAGEEKRAAHASGTPSPPARRFTVLRRALRVRPGARAWLGVPWKGRPEGPRAAGMKIKSAGTRCTAEAAVVGCGGAIGSEPTLQQCFGRRRRRRRRRGSRRPPHRPMPVALCSILARGDCESDWGPPAVWTGRARGARRSGRPTSSGPSCGTRSCPATSATGIPILPSLQFLYGPLPVVLVWPVPGGVSFSGWAGARGRGGAGCRKTCASEGGADRTKHCPGRSLAHRRCLCLESNPCWRPIRVVQHRFPIELLNTSNFCFWSYSCKLVTSVVLFDKNTHFRAIHRGYHQ